MVSKIAGNEIIRALRAPLKLDLMNASNPREPKVAVVVPVYNRIQHTRTFLENFAKIAYQNYEIVIVDDGSSDGTAEVVQKEFPSVRILCEHGDLWWSEATNRGIRDALNRSPDYILTLNDDVIVHPEFLMHLVDYAQRQPGTLVGATIYRFSEPNSLWYAGGKIHFATGELLHREALDDDELTWLTGMGTLIPVSAFRDIGFFDNLHFPQYSGDVDFSMRALLAGYSLAIQPKSILWNKTEESIQLIIRKNVTWKNFLDPLFSKKSDANLKMRANLYWRHWPYMLIPTAFLFFYTRFFMKQLARLVKLR